MAIRHKRKKTVQHFKSEWTLGHSRTFITLLKYVVLGREHTTDATYNAQATPSILIMLNILAFWFATAPLAPGVLVGILEIIGIAPDRLLSLSGIHS